MESTSETRKAAWAAYREGRFSERGEELLMNLGEGDGVLMAHLLREITMLTFYKINRSRRAS